MELWRELSALRIEYDGFLFEKRLILHLFSKPDIMDQMVSDHELFLLFELLEEEIGCLI